MKATGQRVQRVSRSRSFRRASSPEQSIDIPLRSAAYLGRSILHYSLCLACTILGFRLSRESLLAVSSLRSSYTYLPQVTSLSQLSSEVPYKNSTALLLQDTPVLEEPKLASAGVKSSRVHVGRHGILIRPWPHPDPAEMMKAHSLISRVQQEQRRLYGLNHRKPIVVITPTFCRTFQALHLSSLKNTLMLVPGRLLWIVVESPAVSEETASLLADSAIEIHHLGFPRSMPSAMDERAQVESLMRIRGLRYVREQKLEGIVVFADESNVHKLELFDEVQNVHWVGALSVGLLRPTSGESELNPLNSVVDERKPIPQSLSIQGPACNGSDGLVGWHITGSSGSDRDSADRHSLRDQGNFEWAGFVLNAAVVLEDTDKPSWIKDWDDWVSEADVPVGPTAMVVEESFIEPLGGCGHDVLLWWVRAEARADSKFPHGWQIDPQLEVTIPAKHTPWTKTRPVRLSPPGSTSISKSAGAEVVSDLPHPERRPGKQQGKRNPKHSDKRKPGNAAGNLQVRTDQH